jgi:FixJ family two-component response regulator
VETFESAEAFLAREPFQDLGCVILDLRMPGMNGLQFQEELKRRQSSLPVIFLSGQGDIPASVQAMQLGALNFLVKPARAEQVRAAVDAALDRHREILEQMGRAEDVKKRFERLTRRERMVCVLVAQGLLNKQIAHKMGIAEHTVKVHRARVMTKMEADSVAELVRLVDQFKLESLLADPEGLSP